MDQMQASRLVSRYADMILRISYQYLKQTCDAEDMFPSPEMRKKCPDSISCPGNVYSMRRPHLGQ